MVSHPLSSKAPFQYFSTKTDNVFPDSGRSFITFTLLHFPQQLISALQFSSTIYTYISLANFVKFSLLKSLSASFSTRKLPKGKINNSAIHTNKQKLSGKIWHYTHLVHRLITKHDLPAYRRQARPSFSWFSWALQWSTRISTWPPPHLVQKCSFWTAAVRGIFEKAETAQWSQTASADGEKEG